MTKENLKKLEEKIRELVPRLKELTFGCVVKADSIGMWGHRASTFYFKVISVKNLEGGSCMDNVYLLDVCGFQENGMGWKPETGYPKTIEITSYWDRRKDGRDRYELTQGNYHKDFKIIGHPITLEAVLEAIGRFEDGILSNVAVDAAGEFTEEDWIDGRTYPLVRWHFGKSFEDQPEELHDFLFKLFNLEG